mmetsp:Transcript_50630/g.104486  ORF Transcript_50630/g.104486 Transcript_50630/m.104486 type:complete len:192 (-) Transcript_50630:21-596(-)
MIAQLSAPRIVPLLAGGSVAVAGGCLALAELRRELPEPCKVVKAQLSDPVVQQGLGFKAAPWSVRLWHGQVGDCFARITVPLYEETHPFPETLPWFRLPRHRSQVHAALEQRPGVGWVVLSLLEDAGIAEGLKPRRTDDIVAAESGRSVPSSSTQLDAWLRGSEVPAAESHANPSASGLPQACPLSRRRSD